MAINDDATEAYFSSLSLNSEGNEEVGVELSAEDAAWVDSCLVKDAEISGSSWNSLSLLETLVSLHSTSEVGRDKSPRRTDMEILPSCDDNGKLRNLQKPDNSEPGSDVGIIPSSKENGTSQDLHETDSFLQGSNVEILSSSQGNGTSQSLDQTDNFLQGSDIGVLLSNEENEISWNLDRADADIASSSGTDERNTDDSLIYENPASFMSRFNMEEIFLHTYDENMRPILTTDPDVGFTFRPFELEKSTEDIFKVWDLDIDVPAEEDELIKQLNKALAGSSLEPTISVSDDSETRDGLKDKSLDDLVSGFAELSLDPESL